jgi:hypothetical protein
MKLLVAAVLAVFPSSSLAFQLPRFPSSPFQQQQQQQQEQQKPGSYTKTSPVLKAAVGLLTGGLNNVVRPSGRWVLNGGGLGMETRRACRVGCKA